MSADVIEFSDFRHIFQADEKEKDKSTEKATEENKEKEAK